MLSQVGVSALVLAVLFLIPAWFLVEQQRREAAAASAIVAQTQVLEGISSLGTAIASGRLVPRAGARMRTFVRALRANNVRLAPYAPPAVRRGLAADVAMFSSSALAVTEPASVAEHRRVRVDIELDIVEKLGIVERQRLEREHREANWEYAMIGCAVVALLLLLGSGWGSLVRAARSRATLLERVADGAAGDAQSDRLEELYHIVASSGVDPALQIDRALAYARTALAYDWAIAIEWLDGEEPTLTHAPESDIAALPLDALDLERAIAVEASRAGEPVVYRFDRLPAELANLATAPRVFAWRHCVAYAFPGGFSERAPHCALFLASRGPRVAALSEPDRQLLRLVGTLVATAGRNMRHQQRLGGLAFADPLTGMPNRAQLSENLEQVLRDAERTERSFAIHYIDLDGFKRVNDEHGHEIGDEVLKIAAKRMQQVLRENELLARIGGDEFVVVQSAQTRAEASEVAHRLVERLSRPFVIDGRKHRIGGSIGTAMYPEHGRSTVELLRHADAALYASKRGGKGRASFYAPAPAPERMPNAG